MGQKIVVVEKKVEVRVEVITEVEIDVSKIEFEKNIITLKSIMNNGFENINNTEGKIAMAIGPSGCGKSTVSNLIFGTNFETKQSPDDVTRELSNPTQSKFNDLKIIDTVGLTPNLNNLGKIIILLFHHKMFPDFFFYPASNDRIVNLLPLYQLINYSLIKIMIIPFNSNTFYCCRNLYTTLKEKNPSLAAIKSSFNKEIITEMKTYINANSWTGNVVPIMTLNEKPILNGSMKNAFLKEFFKDGQFIEMTYDQYKKNLLKTNEIISIVAMFYGMLIDAVKSLGAHANINQKTHLIESINECQYLKD